jgi:dTDP-4-dehydrorhamnose 3,5-epimerase
MRTADDEISLRTPGARLLPAFREVDARGEFRKVFDAARLERLGLRTAVEEIYVTTSGVGVLRGMHLQLPPHDHVKLVSCLSGRVLDVLLDVRDGSPMQGRFETIELNAARPSTLRVPRGVAHGFCVIDGPAVLLYAVSTRHAPAQDAGIRWDSFGLTWPVRDPVVSARDASLPTLSDFRSPFRFEASAP